MGQNHVRWEVRFAGRCESLHLTRAAARAEAKRNGGSVHRIVTTES